jgi:hypothetical protein
MVRRILDSSFALQIVKADVERTRVPPGEGHSDGVARKPRRGLQRDVEISQHARRRLI